jgi:hypothetical protein
MRASERRRCVYADTFRHARLETADDGYLCRCKWRNGG